jgi:YVTN family beta-propeller protein
MRRPEILLHTLLASFLLFCAFVGAGWTEQLRQVAIVDLPGRPGFDEVAFANGMLVITHEGANTLDVFDPAKRRVVAQVADMAGPHGLAVNPRARKLYVANADTKSIAVISTRDWKVESTIQLETTPFDLTLSPDGRRLYVGHRRDLAISAVDLADGNRVTTVKVGGSPARMLFDVAQRVLFATLQDRSEVLALDPDLKEIARYKLLASQPTGLALDSGSRRLYVTVRNAVLALDASTGREVGRVAAPEGADEMWLDTSAGTLYVASSGGYVTVVKTSDGQFVVADEVRTEVRGHSVAYDPGRHLIYMPGGREGRSKLLVLRYVAAENEPERQVAAK